MIITVFFTQMSCYHYVSSILCSKQNSSAIDNHNINQIEKVVNDADSSDADKFCNIFIKCILGIRYILPILKLFICPSLRCLRTVLSHILKIAHKSSTVRTSGYSDKIDNLLSVNDKPVNLNTPLLIQKYNNQLAEFPTYYSAFEFF